MPEMRFANAPISYGVFGDLTVDGATTTDELLATMAETGYAGSELGPPGFFGSVERTARAFQAAGLEAVGAYVPLNTQRPGPVLDRDIERMGLTLEEIETVNPAALVILADEGDPGIIAQPRKDPSRSLDAAGWKRLVDVVQGAADRARDRGLEVSYHPHVGTYVELPEEIERFLEDTDIPLTYDIGHVALAGGDGVELFRRWRERINHVHIKDVLPVVLEEARVTGADLEEWFPRACTRLGEGGSRLDEFATALRETGYDRWVVVEQDREPLTPESYRRVVADQLANLHWLQRHLADAAEHRKD